MFLSSAIRGRRRSARWMPAAQPDFVRAQTSTPLCPVLPRPFASRHPTETTTTTTGDLQPATPPLHLGQPRPFPLSRRRSYHLSFLSGPAAVPCVWATAMARQAPPELTPSFQRQLQPSSPPGLRCPRRLLRLLRRPHQHPIYLRTLPASLQLPKHPRSKPCLSQQQQ